MWLTLLLVIGLAFISTLTASKTPEPTDYGTFLEQLEDGDIATVNDLRRDNRIEGELREDDENGEPQKYNVTYNVELHREELSEALSDAFADGRLDEYKVNAQPSNVIVGVLVSVLPFLLVFGFFFFMMSQMQGGGNRVMSFGKSRAKVVNKDAPKVTFADVAGADEAVEELREIKDFLENPA